MKTVSSKIWAEWGRLFQIVNVDDPKWANLEVDYLPIQRLQELLPPIRKGSRLIDEAYFSKFLNSLAVSRLKDLADCGFGIGTSEGYFVLNNRSKGFLIDTNKFSEIFSQELNSSVGKIRLNHLT